MYFLIRTVTHQDIKDSDGRLIPTVIAEFVSEQTFDDIAAALGRPKMPCSHSSPPNRTRLWPTSPPLWDGRSKTANHKTKARRCLKELTKQKLLKQTRTGQHKLTTEGEKVLSGEDED